MYEPQAILLQILIVVIGSALTVVLGTVVRFVWERVSARRRWERIAGELAVQVQLDFFEQRLGRPVFESRTPDSIDHYFVHPLFLVQAVTDLNRRVRFFAITTRSKRFAPRLGSGGGIPALSVQLGRDRFVQVVEEARGHTSWLGARRFGYSESHYLGNPGRYLSYVLAFNDGGYTPSTDFAVFLHTLEDRAASDDARAVALRRLRETCTVNTYGEGVSDYDYGALAGPDKDVVRLLD